MMSAILYYFLCFFVILAFTTCEASLVAESSPAHNAFVDFEASVSGKYLLRKFLGNKNEIAVLWTVDEDAGLLRLAVAAEASGWVGFGISDTGGMRGADIVVFEAQSREINDYYSMDYGRPQLDDCPSDWIMVSNIVQDSFIAFEAIRLLDTGDNQDIAIFNDAETFKPPTIVIAAFGDDETLSFHGSGNAIRDALRFHLADKAAAVKLAQNGALTEMPEKSSLDVLRETSDGHILFKANNFTIPQVVSHYEKICMNINEIPELLDEGGNVNLIGFSHKSSAENNGVDTTKYVHHFLLLGLDLECGVLDDIQTMFYVWGPGQTPLVFPDQVSFPFGSDARFQALMLEIHYTNLDADAGIVDDTGIEIFYVKQPREMEAGMLTFGGAPGTFGIDGTIIPKGQSRHDHTCPGACIANSFVKPVTVFAEGVHMHLNGARLVTKVIRDDTRVVQESRLEVFDYDQNGVKLMQIEPYQLIPGRDSLLLSCYYDVEKDGVKFGQETLNEMCVELFWYYPADAYRPNDIIKTNYCGPGFYIDPVCDGDYTPVMVDVNVERVFGTHKGVCSERPQVSEPAASAGESTSAVKPAFKLSVFSLALAVLVASLA